MSGICGEGLETAHLTIGQGESRGQTEGEGLLRHVESRKKYLVALLGIRLFCFANFPDKDLISILFQNHI